MNRSEDWDRYLSREETLTRLERYGLLDGAPGDPTVDTGITIELANRHHIEFCHGLSRIHVRAYLPEQYWARQPKYLGSGWVDRLTIQAAVCHCLIHCFEAGLLNMPPDAPI